MSTSGMQIQEWTRHIQASNTSGETEYLISTDCSLLSIPAIQEAWSQEFIYWAKPLPEADMRKMLENSLCFGVYKWVDSNSDSAATGDDRSHSAEGLVGHKDGHEGGSSEKEKKHARTLQQIGLARLITDHVTFAYLCDVHIDIQYQGAGLGTWLMACIDEVFADMPHLRRVMFLTVGEKLRKYYERVLGAEVVASRGKLEVMGKKGPGSCVRH